MHPLGSIDILLAAGGGFHPSFAFPRQSLRSSIVCLSVTLTPLTPTNILKYLIYDYGHHFFFFFGGGEGKSFYVLFGTACYLCPRRSGPRYFLPRRWAGSGLISVFTKQIEVAACPCARASLLPWEPGWGGGRDRKRDGPHPKRLTCHRPAPSGQARVSVCLCVTEIERE